MDCKYGICFTKMGPRHKKTWPQGYKPWVQSQTQNKAQWLAACGHVRKQPIIALYFEFENELKVYNLKASTRCFRTICAKTKPQSVYPAIETSSNIEICICTRDYLLRRTLRFVEIWGIQTTTSKTRVSINLVLLL